MRSAAISLCLLVVLTGCSARYEASLSSGSGAARPAPAPSRIGTSISTGNAGLQVQTGTNSSLAVTLFAIGLLAGAVEYSRGEPRPFPGPGALLPERFEPTPELAPGRVVDEQDCSKPIDLSSGNLRCR